MKAGFSSCTDKFVFFKILEIEEAGQKGPLFTNYSPIAQLVRAPH